MGSLTTIALLFGVAGQYVGGKLAQRFPMERVIAVLALVVIPSLLILGVPSGFGRMWGAAVFAFVFFTSQPAYNSLVAEYLPRHLQGRGYGIAFFLGFGAGSFSGGFSGYIAQEVGIHWVFLSLAVLGFVLLLFALALLAARKNTDSF